jgi:hypothetical protein
MACDFTWSDGWGDHVCHKQSSHGGDHRCECDATTRRRIDQLAELDRLKLRDELRKLQGLE